VCASKPSLKQARCVSERAQIHRTQGQAAFAECASRCRANVAVMDGPYSNLPVMASKPNADQQFTPPPV
jgi:hypothetical protein